MGEFVDKKQEFVFTVFSEMNDHIRATDEKHVLIVSFYIAMLTVVFSLSMDRLTKIEWDNFFLCSFVWLLGTCVLVLQLWYRAWKEHYLEVCFNIAAEFDIDDKFLPFCLLA